jgi:hypothetical protein
MVNSYINLAAVYLNGFKDEAKAKKALTTALKIKADLTLPDAVSTPEMRELLGSLGGVVPMTKTAATPKPAAAAPPAPKPAPPPPSPPVEAKAKESPEEPPPPKSEGNSDDPDLPASIPQPLYCPNPDEAPPGERIALRCVTQPNLSVARVLLYYRAVGDEKFASVRTARSAKGWYSGVVPPEATGGKALQYYFEARDASDEVAGNSGRSDSPNVILLRESADNAEAAVSARRADEDPLKAAEGRRREHELASRNRRAPGSFYVGVAGGSGYGWQPGGNRLEFYTDAQISAGALPSGTAQVVPEIGYQIADAFALSLQARFQWIPATGTDNKRGAPATGALAVLARGEFFIGTGSFQGTVSLYAGGGEGFRLTQEPTGQIKRNDSVLGGPGVGGAGAGIIFHLSRHFALTVDVRGLAGFPTFAIVGDGNAGVQVAF